MQQVSEIEKKINNWPSASYQKPPVIKTDLCGKLGHINQQYPKKNNGSNNANQNQTGNIDLNLLQELLKQLGKQG